GNYVELSTTGENAETAKGFGPIAENEMFGQTVFLFEGVDRQNLDALGETRTPSVADLFVAKVKGARK
ncbi:MAG: ABC transporter ATP-binding protein, partial [Woeseiaceae bacterium]